jgi:hypothetical protein
VSARDLGVLAGMIATATWRPVARLAGALTLLWGAAQFSTAAAACLAGAGLLAISMTRGKR